MCEVHAVVLQKKYLLRQSISDVVNTLFGNGQVEPGLCGQMAYNVDTESFETACDCRSTSCVSYTSLPPVLLLRLEGSESVGVTVPQTLIVHGTAYRFLIATYFDDIARHCYSVWAHPDGQLMLSDPVRHYKTSATTYAPLDTASRLYLQRPGPAKENNTRFLSDIVFVSSRVSTRCL